ncbi:MAG: type II toxin-antitoxin system PemK/MazF family toxin [Faecalibacterium sp.]|nr:type II toxin-antitoxin system PemK/MazF family toxin [Ruminococcus sp.]MCM1391476.1 type II toxin-antitoxin system PemK/MazF family toxin [Ruminococcus sp.]MCM1485266.1 type II toxin-antitoxin system PemK/MazF family toxin [Faecalibacterium sp.]
MDFKKWEIYLANVKFEDIDESKIRPVLILQDGNFVPIECLKMTSQSPRKGEYALRNWKEAGLRKPTVVRISKTLRLHPSEIIKRIGKLDLADIVSLEQLLMN